MKDKLDKYFAGELDEQEKKAFLSEVNENPLLKKEFIIKQNLLAITSLLPRESDIDSAKASLEKFEDKMNKNESAKKRKL